MTPHNSDAGLPDGKGLEVVAWRIRYRSEPGMIGHYPWTYTGCARAAREDHHHDVESLVTKSNAEAYATARVAASQAEIAYITASRDEWAEECGFRLAERDAALAREKVLREAGEFAVDSFDMLLQWCVKNVKMWNFPQYDNAHKDLDRLRAALNPLPAAGDSAAATQESST